MKIISLISALLLFISPNFSFAQAPIWEWAKSGGGSNFDEAHSVTADPAGNVIVLSAITSPTVTFGNTTLTNASLALTKYDPSGNVLWAQMATGTTASCCSTQQVTSDFAGNLYVIGTFAGSGATFGSTTIPNNGTNSIYFAKYDPNGNLLWVKGIGGSNSSVIAGGVTTDAAGNAIITASLSNSVTLGSQTLNSNGAGDILIAKYDPNGNFIWANNFGGIGSDGGTAITTDNDDNIFVTGYFSQPGVNFGSFTLTHPGPNNILVYALKLDSNGNALWAHTAGGNYAFGHGVAADNLGGVYVYGTNHGSDAFLLKYSSTGALQWNKLYQDGVNLYLSKISSDQAGNAYITGNFSSFIIAQIAPNGSENWILTGGNSFVKYATTAVSLNSSVYVVGGFSGSANFGSSTITSLGSSDMFVAKLSAPISAQAHCDFSYTINGMVVSFSRMYPNCTGFIWDFGNGNTSSINPNPIVTYATPGTYSACFQCGVPASCLTCVTLNVPSNGGGTTGIEDTNTASSILFYPNPSSGNFRIESKKVIEKLEVFDGLGRPVKYHYNSTEIRISNPIPGIYFLKVTQPHGVLIRRLVVE